MQSVESFLNFLLYAMTFFKIYYDVCDGWRCVALPV